jgi:hypothetical protein
MGWSSVPKRGAWNWRIDEVKQASAHARTPTNDRLSLNVLRRLDSRCVPRDLHEHRRGRCAIRTACRGRLAPRARADIECVSKLDHTGHKCVLVRVCVCAPYEASQPKQTEHSSTHTTRVCEFVWTRSSKRLTVAVNAQAPRSTTVRTIFPCDRCQSNSVSLSLTREFPFTIPLARWSGRRRARRPMA